jgi:hypothetical protein
LRHSAQQSHAQTEHNRHRFQVGLRPSASPSLPKACSNRRDSPAANGAEAAPHVTPASIRICSKMCSRPGRTGVIRLRRTAPKRRRMSRLRRSDLLEDVLAALIE